MHYIAMVAGDTELGSFAVADDILFSESVLLAEVCTKPDGFLVNGRKIRGIGQTVLADFKADMCIIGRAAGMPTSMIPGQRLVGGDASISQFADKAVDTDLPATRLILIPVVVILVLAEQIIVRSDITFETRVVGPGGMHRCDRW